MEKGSLLAKGVRFGPLNVREKLFHTFLPSPAKFRIQLNSGSKAQVPTPALLLWRDPFSIKNKIKPVSLREKTQSCI